MNEEELKNLIREQFEKIISEQEESPEGDEPDAPASASVHRRKKFFFRIISIIRLKECLHMLISALKELSRYIRFIRMNFFQKLNHTFPKRSEYPDNG